MTRGQQTAWIVGTMIILAIALAAFGLDTDDPCDGLFGIKDRQCVVDRAVDHLMSL